MDKHCADATNKSLASLQGEFAVHLGDLRAAQHPQAGRDIVDLQTSHVLRSSLILHPFPFWLCLAIGILLYFNILMIFLFFYDINIIYYDIAYWLSYLSILSLLPLLSSWFFPFTFHGGPFELLCSVDFT